jgi:hypothetical protein
MGVSSSTDKTLRNRFIVLATAKSRESTRCTMSQTRTHRTQQNRDSRSYRE